MIIERRMLVRLPVPKGRESHTSKPFKNKEAIMGRTLRVLITLLLLIVFGALLTGDFVNAMPVIDQQQSVINTEAGVVIAIGGRSAQKLAQVVTAGITGALVEIRFAVGCSSGINLIVEIQGVSNDKPNGVVLTSHTFTDIGDYTIPPIFKNLLLPNPIPFSTGDRFAIVLSATPNPSYACSTYPGPEGDSYPGGNAFFDSRPNPPGWVPMFNRSDLPFQTLVESPLPDLIISYFPRPISINREIIVQYSVKNQGFGDAGPSRLDLYLSENRKLNLVTDYLLGSVNIPALKPDEEAPLPYGTASFILPKNFLKHGPWFIIGVADSADAVEESNENNNIKKKIVVVK